MVLNFDCRSENISSILIYLYFFFEKKRKNKKYFFLIYLSLSVICDTNRVSIIFKYNTGKSGAY